MHFHVANKYFNKERKAPTKCRIYTAASLLFSPLPGSSSPQRNSSVTVSLSLSCANSFLVIPHSLALVSRKFAVLNHLLREKKEERERGRTKGCRRCVSRGTRVKSVTHRHSRHRRVSRRHSSSSSRVVFDVLSRSLTPRRLILPRNWRPSRCAFGPGCCCPLSTAATFAWGRSTRKDCTGGGGRELEK